MPAYNFKGQFAGMVADGSKPHTIRKRRKRPTVVGDTLYLYTRMRQKGCRRLREPETCVKVTPISITQESARVMLGGKALSIGEIAELAWRDGFRGIYPTMAFLVFFSGTYGPDFEGELIEWQPSAGTRRPI